MRAPADRYTAFAILLHWAIAAAIAANIAIGWWMHEAIEAPGTALQAFAAFQLHKSIGLLVLGLSLVRLGWRLLHPPPPLPDAMPAWEKLAAKAVHWAFYALMIAIPLSGWIYVSAQWRGDGPLLSPTRFFGLVDVPHLFGLANAAPETRAEVSGAAIDVHEALVWAMIALAALHAAAALKHQFLDRDAVFGHMVPGLSRAPRDVRRSLALGGGFALIAVGAAAAAIAFFQTPAAPAPAPEPSVATTAPPAPVPAPVAEEPAPAAEPAAQGPSAWAVDYDASAITFSVAMGEAEVRGAFPVWRAEIIADPGDLESASVRLTLDAAAATIDFDELRPYFMSAEGLDTANHPTITFRATRLRARGGDAYEVRGDLQLKGRSVRIDAPLSVRITGGRATVTGRVTLDRRDADIGMISDPGGEFVAREIEIEIAVHAARAP